MGVVGRRVSFLALVVVAASLWPASAWAATGALQNGAMVYTADNGESNAVVFTFDTTTSNYVVADAPTVSIAATPPCFNPGGDTTQMACPADGGFTAQPVTLFQASLGDGNDSISLVADLPTSIGAGGGADTMN